MIFSCEGALQSLSGSNISSVASVIEVLSTPDSDDLSDFLKKFRVSTRRSPSGLTEQASTLREDAVQHFSWWPHVAACDLSSVGTADHRPVESFHIELGKSSLHRAASCTETLSCWNKLLSDILL